MDSRGPGALLRLSKSGEDVANGLITFREALPQHAELHLAQRDRRYEPSFHRIRQDLSLVQTSLEITLHACFEMFDRTSLGRSYEMVWGDLHYRMIREENHGLFERLELYVAFLTALRCMITETPAEDLDSLRDIVGELVEAQSLTAYQEPGATDLTRQRSSPGRRRRSRRQASPAPRRPASVVYANGMSPDPYARQTPPEVPYAPYYTPEPYSPAFTSGSSEPLMSSHTSYSDDQFYTASSPPTVHWAVEVFDGSNPSHSFRGDSQSTEHSACYGTSDEHAPDNLAANGFVRVYQQAFDNDTLWVRLYWRPPDDRSRILIITKHERYIQYYSTALSNLRVIRAESCLQLCKLGRISREFEQWANLNFGLYERMVLFYNTFVAMKRHDSRPVPHSALLDSQGLIGGEYGETQLYGGTVFSGSLQHAIRIFKDHGSGVVRIEASARRGPMKYVPIWTAFVTHYKDDPDHVMLESRRVVSFAALRPKPYIFTHRYDLPRNEHGDYVLEFTTSDDAQEFVETWHSLRRMTSMRFD